MDETSAKYNYSIMHMNYCIIGSQGWEFAYRFSERIASFLRKYEEMSDSLKITSHSLIRSFLVSDLSDSLTSLTRNEGMSKSRKYEGMSDSLKITSH